MITDRRKTKQKKRKQPREKTNKSTKASCLLKNKSMQALPRKTRHPSFKMHQRNAEIVGFFNYFFQDESKLNHKTPSPENNSSRSNHDQIAYDEQLFFIEMQKQMECIQLITQQIDNQNKQYKQLIKKDLLDIMFPQKDFVFPEASNSSMISLINIGSHHQII